MSFHQRLLVIGGSGFIGSHLVARLAAQGRQVLVPTRRYTHARHLLPLPTVDIVEADVNDDATLARLVAGQDAVINLVGVLHSDRGDPYGKIFRAVHVELPRRVARTCVTQGVERLLHMSALGADPKGPSMYLRSRGDGELAVRGIFDAWQKGELTIFRPSVVFGPEDRFMNTFAKLARCAPVLPVASADSRLQPIWVGDVANAMATALDERRTYGKIYPLAGPHAYTLGELVERAAAWSGHPRRVLRLPTALGRLQAALLEHMPGTPMLTRDNLDSLKRDAVLDTPLAAELNLRPTALDAVVPRYLGSRP
jgi:NADH dehydrogenase